MEPSFVKVPIRSGVPDRLVRASGHAGSIPGVRTNMSDMAFSAAPGDAPGPLEPL